MNISIIAYASQTGLGYQTKSLYDELKPYKTLWVDLSRLNGMPINVNWYRGKPNQFVRLSRGIPDDYDMKWLVDGSDIVFVCETPLNYNLFKFAEEAGAKTFLQCNFEFLDYKRRPDLPKPTVLAPPTGWNTYTLKKMKVAPVKVLPVPTPIKSEFIPNKKLKTIGHIIGRPAYEDRNGTEAFLMAIRNFDRKFQYKIFLQSPKEAPQRKVFDDLMIQIERTRRYAPNIEVIADTHSREEIYNQIDLLILPRKYGGLCLPAREAMAFGVPTLMPDISPNNEYLPSEFMFDAKKDHTIQLHMPVDVYLSKVESIIETFNNLLKEDFEKIRLKAYETERTYRWHFMREIYINEFEKWLK